MIIKSIPDDQASILRFSSVGVSHGMTTAQPTNVFGSLEAISSGNGGLAVWGLSDTDSNGLTLNGVIGSSDPTDMVSSVVIRGYKSNGSTFVQALGNAETILNINNTTNSLITVLGNGYTGFGTITPGAPITIVAAQVSDGNASKSQMFIYDSTDIAASPVAGIRFGTKYKTDGTMTSMGGIQVCKENVTDNNNASYLVLLTSPNGGVTTERMRLTSTGNVNIGSAVNRAGTVGTNTVNIFDGTPPTSTLTNGCSIYSSGGKLYAMDAAGSATQLTP
jgi:hypothetical protein